MKIYNTLSRRDEEIIDRDLKMVICGPTLYDYMHLGHARLFVILDVFARYLKYQGYKPLMLVILTDVDPKIFIKVKSVTEYKEFIKRYMDEFIYDLSLLNIDMSNLIFGLASDHLTHAHDYILKLMDEGYAYPNKGNIYFDISSVKDYGYLSRFKLKPVDLIEGKRSIYDFMIWNGREEFLYYMKSKLLGRGLPWWHMQDVSIALSNLSSYTIHAGATELIYPHHEAQRAILHILGKEPSSWLHINLLTVNGEKMGKSNNNTIRVRDAIIRYGVNPLRLYLISKDYREEMEFNYDELLRVNEQVKRVGYGSSDIEMDTINTEDIIERIESIKGSIVERVLGLRL